MNMSFAQRIEKFLRTAQENPDLPVYCWVDYEVVGGDEYGRWLGEIGDCRVSNLAMYNDNIYEDQEELIEAYYNQHDDEYEGWDDKEIDADIIEHTKYLWHKAILVNVDLPDSTYKWEDKA